MICSTTEPPPSQTEYFTCSTDEISTLFVMKRPYLNAFLQTVSSFCNLISFTSAEPGYANPILNRIEKQANVMFKSRYFYSDCSNDKYGRLTKEISAVRGASLENSVILDDNAAVHEFNEENSIKISHWRGDYKDRELQKVSSLLRGLVEMDKPVPETLQTLRTAFQL